MLRIRVPKLTSSIASSKLEAQLCVKSSACEIALHGPFEAGFHHVHAVYASDCDPLHAAIRVLRAIYPDRP